MFRRLKELREVIPRQLSARHISTRASYPINFHNKTVGIIIRTVNDKQKGEPNSRYARRSMMELQAQIPQPLKDSELMYFKVNMSAIDPDSYQKKLVKPIKPGHVVSAIVTCDEEKGFNIMDGSLVSKNAHGFESSEKYFQEKLISSDHPLENAPDQEFYIFIDCNTLDLKLNLYLEKIKELIKDFNEGKPGSEYTLEKNACGQAIYEACTRVKYEGPISTQRAFCKTLLMLTKNNPELTDVIKKCFEDSGIGKAGDQIGREILNQKKESTPPVNLTS